MVSRKTPSLPDKIYLINSMGYYYSLGKDGVSLNKTSPDKSCVVTVEYQANPDEFYLRACDGGYFQYHKLKRKDNHIVPKPAKKKTKKPKRPITFSLLEVAEKDTFLFRTSQGKFMVLEVNEKKRIILGDFYRAKIKVGDPAIKRLLTNLAYDLNSSTITDIMPEVALKTTVRNDSQSASTQNITYNYLVSHFGGWSNGIGASLSPKAVGKGKLPSLVDGTIVLAENYSHVEILPQVERKTATSSVPIPAMTRAVATVLVFKAIIQVPFTYIEALWYRSGEFVELSKHGVYSNKVTFGVDIELTDVINIDHSQ